MTDLNSGCQGASTPPHTERPWAGTPREDDHDDIEKLLAEMPEGAPVSWIATTLFGPDVESGARDWQFVKRHCKRYHQLFRPQATVAVQEESGNYENREKVPDLVWVKPSDTRRRCVLDTASEHNRPGRSTSVALTNAQGLLGRHRTLDSAAVWGELIGAFGGKRTGHDRAPDGTHTNTRFNSVSRALQSVNRVGTAFDGAAQTYDRGAMVTGTTDLSRFESIHTAAEGLLVDVQCLRKKLARELGTGLPPGIVAPEPTARGSPHAHLVVFGPTVDELPSQHDLHNYWHTHRERGQQITLNPIEFSHTRDEWVWAAADPTEMGCPPASYLSMGANALVATAETPTDDILAVADAYRAAGDRPVGPGPEIADDVLEIETAVNVKAVRLAAWYWATEMKAATRPSPQLRASA